MPDQNDKPLSDGALFVADEEDDLDDDDEGRGGAAKRSRGTPGDGKAEAAVEVLDGILARMDLDTEIGIREDGERIVLDVTGPDSGRAIGRKGQTLDALQFLVNKVVNRFPTGRRHVVVDSGDYRDRHDRGLVSLAKRQAKKAVQQGRVITLEPMSARDRRVIHLSLAKFPGVTTKSNGEGLGRRIQIIPARRRAGGRDRGFGDRDRGFGDRDRGFGDRDRGFGDRDRGFGDRDRDRGPTDRDRDRGPTDRDRDRGPTDRDRDRGPMDRDRDRGPADRDRDRGPMDRDRDRGPADRDRDRGPIDRDRDRGPRSHDRD